MKLAQAFTLAVLSLALTACQTARIIDRPTPAEISRLDRGEVVGVLLVDGTRHELVLREVTATHLTGAEQGRTVAVPIEAIAELCHQKRAASAPIRKALEQALAAIAASLALATGDQDSVNTGNEP